MGRGRAPFERSCGSSGSPTADTGSADRRTSTATGRSSADQRAQLVVRSEGNPLFVEQMLALLGESETGAEPVSIPPTIQALLAARLDRLAIDELQAIGAASVVGREFWREALAALAPAGEGARLDAALDALVRKQLVGRERVALTGENGFAFRHALIRDAAYESLTKEGRAELHERFATWVEGRYHERLASSRPSSATTSSTPTATGSSSLRSTIARARSRGARPGASSRRAGGRGRAREDGSGARAALAGAGPASRRRPAASRAARR